MSAALVISLDFELYWGVRDLSTLEASRQSILAERAIVPRLLELFSSHHVNATWAAVGFLFCESKDELVESLPDVRPTYEDPRLSPYAHIESVGPDEERDPFHYAPSLIRQIASVPGQEIASHTLSHYYCLEAGQDAAAFEADMRAAAGVAERRGITLESLVFPRNQVNPAYLRLLPALGVRSYRGTGPSWLYRGRPRASETTLMRGFRLLDAYAGISRHNLYPAEKLRGDPPHNIAASRYLRPHELRLGSIQRLRQRRILEELESAARDGLVYHLWWHPQDFGPQSETNLAVLERILDRFSALRERYGMRSCSMRDLAEAAPV